MDDPHRKKGNRHDYTIPFFEVLAKNELDTEISQVKNCFNINMGSKYLSLLIIKRI